MSRSVLAALVATSFLVAPHAAQAAIDVAGADALRTTLQQGLDQQKSNLKLQGYNLVTTGDLKIEPKGTYYAVTYPHFVLDLSTKDKVDVGVLTMNVMPGDTDKQLKMTVAVPSPIRFLDAAGKEEGHLDIGSQKIAMVIDTNYSLPKILDAELKNLVLVDPTQALKLTIDSASAKINYTEGAPGVWTGPSVFNVHNVQVDAQGKGATDKVHASIADINVNTNAVNMDMNIVKQYQAKMAELGEAGLSLDKDMSPASMAALWSILTDYGFQQADAMRADLVMTDMKFSNQKKDSPTPVAFGIGKIGYGFDIADMRAEKAKGGFRFNLNNITPTGIPADLISYVPQNMTINFGFKDLPFKAVMAQLGQMAQQGAAIKNGQAPDANVELMAKKSVMEMPALLGKAGTVFTLDNTNISTTNYGLNLNGQFASNPQAIYTGTGNLKAVFGGLDQLITDLQALSQKPGTDPKIAGQITQALSALAMAQMMGQQGTDAAGKSARIYDFGLDAAGNVTLNGASMAALMGGGAPQGAPPAGGPMGAPH